MALEMSYSDTPVCVRCGTRYTKVRGNFIVSYASNYKGVGRLPYCKDCVESMYNSYVTQCNDPKLAVRQMCRKLDLFWSETIYNNVEKVNTPRSLMIAYITKLNSPNNAGKCYDDTLLADGTLWVFGQQPQQAQNEPSVKETDPALESNSEPVDDYSDITDEVIAFWGSGYPMDMYRELEQRRTYYVSKLPKGTELDIGSEVLIRQICNLEVSIAKDSAAGKSIDKSVNSLNTLLGSLNLKPAQQKDNDMDADLASTPMGVWLYRYENKRPLPEVDEQLKDVNHVKKYVFTWMGHLVKMLGIKNGYTKLYDEEIERLRVERPEYADEDDEDLMIDAYSDGEENG